jgi:hypothetical protein
MNVGSRRGRENKYWRHKEKSTMVRRQYDQSFGRF